MNSSRREIVGFSAGGTAERNLTWLNWSFPIDMSADGKTVLFNEQNIQPNGVYLRKLDGSPAVRIGEGTSYGFSPDGRWALSTRVEQDSQFTLLPTGAGEPKVLPKGGIAYQGAGWFPDGRRILISGNEPGRGSRLFVQDVAGRKAARDHSRGGPLHLRRRLPGRQIGRGDRPGPPRRHLSDRARRAPRRAGARARRHSAPVDGGRELDLYVYRPSALPLRIETVDVTTGRRDPLEASSGLRIRPASTRSARS